MKGGEVVLDMGKLAIMMRNHCLHVLLWEGIGKEFNRVTAQVPVTICMTEFVMEDI